MGGNVEYPLLDALGSVRQLTSNTGVNLLKRSYTADGSIRFSSGSGISRLGFAGELQDTTTGIVYLRARHYNPALGRFLQRDSFGGFTQRPQSLNRYSYAENNAVNYTDPSGHYIETALDVAFISYDVGRIIRDNILNDCGNLGSNLTALALDSLGFALPVITGLGVAYRTGKAFGWVSRIGRWAEDANILRKTGIWGGTFRKIGRLVEDGVVLGVRPRPIMAQFWEYVWRLTGQIKPKPLKEVAEAVTERKWWNILLDNNGRLFGIDKLDTGLRRLTEGAGEYWAHSDIDIQFIVQNGVPVTLRDAGDSVFKTLNEQLGYNLFAHGDNLSGIFSAVEGAAQKYLTDPAKNATILISQSGFAGSGEGMSSLLNLIQQDLRDAFLQALSKLP